MRLIRTSRIKRWVTSMILGGRQALVISEADIEAALDHLRSLPQTAPLPVNWHRQRLLLQIREAIGKRPKLSDCVPVAPGVFAYIRPSGVDNLSPEEFQGRLQVWLLIRGCGTDPARLIYL